MENYQKINIIKDFVLSLIPAESVITEAPHDHKIHIESIAWNKAIEAMNQRIEDADWEKIIKEIT